MEAVEVEALALAAPSLLFLPHPLEEVYLPQEQAKALTALSIRRGKAHPSSLIMEADQVEAVLFWAA